MTSTNRLLAYNKSTGEFDYITCDNGGSMNVAFASTPTFSIAANQSVSINNLPEVQNVSDADLLSNVQGSNVAIMNQLELLNNKIGASQDNTSPLYVTLNGYDPTILNQESTQLDIKNGLTALNNVIQPLQTQSIRYLLGAAASLAPLTVPQFSRPPVSLPASGWYFKNTALNQPSQLYYYSFTNPALQVPARQKTYQIQNISTGYCVVSILAMNNSQGLPFMAIYSQPTGSGDSVPGFYKSRVTYGIPSNANLTQGMKVMLYFGAAPDNRIHPEITRIQLFQSSTNGPGLGTENLAFLSINSDSGAAIGNSEFIIHNAGFVVSASSYHDCEFSSDSDDDLIAQSSNAAICARLDGSNSVINSLNSKVIKCNTDSVTLSNQITGFSTEATLSLLNTNHQNSNAAICQRLDGSNSSVIQRLDSVLSELQQAPGLPIQLYAASYESPGGFVQLKATETNNGLLIKNIDGPLETTQWAMYEIAQFSNININQRLDDLIIETQSGNSSVINQLQASNVIVSALNGKITKCDTDHVSIANQITGFSTESTLSSLNANQQYSNVNICQRLDGSNVVISAINGKITKCDTDHVFIANQITGFSTESTLSALKDNQQYSNVNICQRLDGSNVVISAINGKITKCDTDHVSIANQITGFSTESTLSALKDNQQYSNVNICQRLDGSNAVISSMNGKITKCDTDHVSIINQITGFSTAANQTTLNNTLADSNVSICAKLDNSNTVLSLIKDELISGILDTNILNSHLDCRVFGNSTGSSYHALHCTSQGEIVSVAKLYDESENGITSTVVSTKRGLDVNIIGGSSGGSTTVNFNQSNTYGYNGTSWEPINSKNGNLYVFNSNIDLIKANSDTILSDVSSIKTSIQLIDNAVNGNNYNVILRDENSLAFTGKINGGTNALQVSLCDNLGAGITSTSNRLNTNSYLNANGTLITATGNSLNINQTNNPSSIDITASSTTLTATGNSLNVNQTNNPSTYKIILPTSTIGSTNNIVNQASLASGANTTALDCSTYTDSTLSYEDTSTANTGTLIIYASIDGGTNYVYIGRIIPIFQTGSLAGKRFAVVNLKLAPYSLIRLNNDSSDTISNIKISLISQGST